MAALIRDGASERCHAHQPRGIVKAACLTPPHNPPAHCLARANMGIRTVSLPGPAGCFSVTGRTARALVARVRTGERSVTVLEAASWAYRLAAHVFDPRGHRLAIEMTREPHDDAGGWQGRYVLRSPVTLGEGGGV